MINWIYQLNIKCNHKCHHNHKTLCSDLDKKLLKVVRVYYIDLKTMKPRNALFSWQKVCEYQPISPSILDDVCLYCAWENQHILSIIGTCSALWVCLAHCKHVKDKAAAPGSLYLDSYTTQRLIVQMYTRAKNKWGLQDHVVIEGFRKELGFKDVLHRLWFSFRK